MLELEAKMSHLNQVLSWISDDVTFNTNYTIGSWIKDLISESVSLSVKEVC